MKTSELETFQDHVIAMVMSSPKKPWFNICLITDACKMIGINDYYKRPTYQLLKELHCQDYNGMTPELMGSIRQMIREVLTPTPSKMALFWRWIGSTVARQSGDTVPDEVQP
jgi:prophage antirepressor-like protein